MSAFFRNRHIPVEFRDIQPTHVIDTSPFESSVYTHIKLNGISISPFKLIHCAAVHYQSRFRKSASLRWLNSFLELNMSLSNNNKTRLYLTDIESNEFQTKSSEVIAVGLSVFLFMKLLNVNSNRISVIEATGKRCDFSALKNGMEIFFESKGRKYSSAINTAIKDVFSKKSLHTSRSKYGVVSYLPRNSSPVDIVVVDPDSDNNEISRKDKIIRLLIHYAKQSKLVGFWKLAELLNIRISKLLLAGSNINGYENVPLDYQNIYKIGIGYEIFNQDIKMETFFPANKEHGFYYKIDNQVYFLSLDKKLVKLLEQQRFSDLLEYQCILQEDDIIEINQRNFFSINKDGSILSAIAEDDIPT